MIVSENSKPELHEFRALMKKIDIILNDDAKSRPEYYAGRSGTPLEDDVLSALQEGAIGTPFANTIIKVSGSKFPDIVAAKFYGVEVKSTKSDHWKSTGSSILESTRLQDVERIYMTFGKLGGVPAFLSRPYEECLSGIAVTHMPRYLIDMRLQNDETIFSKMGIPYDEFRNLENPVAPVSRYYKSKLKPGESLWWSSDSADDTAPITLKIWNDKMPKAEKDMYTIYGCINYPEIFAGDYSNYSLWLVTANGIVDNHVRDQFSSGGKKEFLLAKGEKVLLPAIYQKVKERKDIFINAISSDCSNSTSSDATISPIELQERILKWCKLASRNAANHHSRPCRVKYEVSMEALKSIFEDYLC